MKITLIGYMGAGKSTLGKALAAQLKLPFNDLDALVQEREATSVKEIIHNKGELYFRKLEQEELSFALQTENLILAVGGGTPCYYNNMALINEYSKSCYLRVSPKILAERLASTQAERPLLAHLENEEIAEFTAKHLFERSAFYEEAHLIVDGNQATEHIIDKIKTHFFL